MGRLSKIVSLVALLGALIMVGSCGGGDDAPVVVNPSAVAPIAATLNPNGTATTGANTTTVATPPGTPGYLGAVTVTLAPSTVITAKNADGSAKAMTAAPSFTFTAPADSTTTFSGVNGVPAPTGFTTLTSTSGAIDLQLTGAAKAAFSPDITITMPVPGKDVGAVIEVYTVTGTEYELLGSFTVQSKGLVSFPVSSLSWKVGDPNPKPGAPTTAPTTIPTTVPTTTPATTTITTGTTTVQATTTVPATTVPTTTPATSTTTTATTTVPPTTAPTTIPTTVAPSCVACHGIPPTTGRHTVHVNTAGISCAVCHGSGYSNNTTNATLHLNGVVDIVGTIGWDATSRSCANSCHGSRTW